MQKFCNLALLQHDLSAHSPSATTSNARFFKTGSGEYAEHDRFLGITVPIIRQLAKKYQNFSFTELESIIQSSWNEERLLALLILTTQYQKASEQYKKEIYDFYMNHISYINNWNLVDSSAHLIIGAHIWKQKDKQILLQLAHSSILWHRRIAIIATWYFIKNNDFEWTFTIAYILLHDTHDLIHKAVGWMLREVGKRDKQKLVDFLYLYSQHMPRTMLRYAIEKFSQEERDLMLGR